MSRNILITGVSRGLGQALVDGILAEGHRVAGCSRNVDEAEKAAESTKNYRVDSVDLTDDAAVGRWIENVVTDWGVPDLVINNAGVIAPNQPLWEV